MECILNQERRTIGKAVKKVIPAVVGIVVMLTVVVVTFTIAALPYLLR